MDKIRERATDQFPMVLLTLLSIVQALALEFLWDHLRHRTDLYELSMLALLGWIQIATSLMGIILIWLTYTGIVMRFRWTPSTTDSVFPFFVGLIQFLMIDLMGPERLGQWLIVLAIVFAMMMRASHTVFRRARQDPTNSAWFENVSPAQLRDFIPHLFVVTVITIMGIWLWQSESTGWVALVSVFFALIAICHEIYRAAKFWNQSMGIE